MLVRRVRPTPRSSPPASPTHRPGAAAAVVVDEDEDDVEVLPPHFRPFALRAPSHSSAHTPRTADAELPGLFDFDAAAAPARGRASTVRRFSLASTRRSLSRSVEMERDRSTGRRDLDELLCSSSSEDEDEGPTATHGYEPLSASTLRMAPHGPRSHGMSPRATSAPLGSDAAAPQYADELLDGLATPLASHAPPPSLPFARRPSASLGSPPMLHSPTSLSRRASASGSARIPPLSLSSSSRRHSRESSVELSSARSATQHGGSSSQASSLLRLKLSGLGHSPPSRLSVPTSPSQLASSAPSDTRKRSNTGPPTLSVLRPLTPLTSPTLVSAASFAPAPQPHSAPLAVSALSRPRSRIASAGGTQSVPCTHTSSPQLSPTRAPSFSSFAGSSQAMRRDSLLSQQRPADSQEPTMSEAAQKPAPPSPSSPSPPSLSMASPSSPPIAIPPPSRPSEFLEGPWRASSNEPADACDELDVDDTLVRLSPQEPRALEAAASTPDTFSDALPTSSLFWSISPLLSPAPDVRQALPRMLSLPSLRPRVARSGSSTSVLQPRSTQQVPAYASLSASSSAQSTPTLGKRRLGTHSEHSPPYEDRSAEGQQQPETPERVKRRAARSRRERAPPLPRRRSVDGAALR